ncbi:MAG TPA: ABC transporter permease [Gemmatimonadaceae bacterium]|nr:ABC transporter permease [Gemmatimonadaceae bacterium]
MSNRRLFKFPWRSGTTIARDVDDELSFHFDMRIAELRSSGLNEEAAQQQARTEFGDVEFTRAYCRNQDESAARDDRRADMFAEWRQDIVYAVRTLRRSPAFAAVSLVTLAIAIGANTAVFAVSRSVLLQPLPYADASRLYRIGSTAADHPGEDMPLSPADYADIAREQTVFSGVGAISQPTQLIWHPESGDPKSLEALVVGANIFSVLGTPALRGRTLLPSDAAPGNNDRVVLSFTAWQRDFGGDPDVIGRSIRLDDASYLVVGVMPRGFLIGQSEELWIPYDEASTIADVARARKQHYIFAVGRLKPGVTQASTLADVRLITAQLARQYPEADSASSAIIHPLRDIITGDLRPALLLLQAAAALVLLIACANLANLALSRTMGRRRELATRTALGARRGRLLQQLVTESLVLSVAGGIVGVGLAIIGTRWLLSLNPTTLPPVFDVTVNGGVLAFSVIVSLVTGIVFGLPPALGASSGNLQESLKEGGRGTSGGRAGGTARRALVVAQIALALMLLIGAGLLMRSFAQLSRVTLGYDPTDVVVADVDVAGNRYDDPSRINALYKGVFEQLSRTPGIVAVGAMSTLPTHGGPSTSLRIEGEQNDEAHLPDLIFLDVNGDFFKAMRVPIIAGRAYDESDSPDRPETAIINETAAKRYFPNGDAVGRRISIGPDPHGTPMTIVGVAGDIRSGKLDMPVSPTLYANHRKESWIRSLSLVVRTSRSLPDAETLIRRAVRAQDPTLAVSNVQTLNEVIGSSLSSRRFALRLAMSFALIALVLAAVGIYGVLAYAVASRTREFGIRIALGASSGRVMSLVVGQAIATSLAGIAIGLGGAVLAGRVLRGMLFGVTAVDAATYAAVVMLLLAVAVAACAVPAWRATQVDPLISMRTE